MNKKIRNISVIIPTKNFLNIFIETFNSLLSQTILPNEIIIVDSSDNNEICEFINKSKYKIDNKINILYFKVNHSFPGEARNKGLNAANNDILAILDSKTIPKNSWLEQGLNKLDKNDVVFGSTKYLYKTKYQKLLRCATHGSKPVETTPGSIFKKKIIEDKNYFISNVRTADDYEWRERIKKIYKCDINQNYLEYKSLPKDYFSSINRYFIYSLHTARVNVQKNLKDLYLTLFLLLSFLIIPRINYLIGYSESSLILSNITQLFFLYLITLILINLFFNFSFKNNNFILTDATIKIILYILIFLLIYNWNTKISKYVFNSTLWIPHITKITLSFIIFLSFIYRGVFRPISRGENYNYLFPFNWFLVGLIGLSIDIFKAPGYLLGSFSYFLININKDKNNSRKKILFLSPYPFDVQAGQRIKYEKHYPYFRKDYDVHIDSFFDNNTWKVLYKRKAIFKKLINFTYSSFRRLFILFKIRSYDIIYIHMWVNPVLYSIYERLFYFFGKKVIVDIEDNILLNKYNKLYEFSPFIRSYAKYIFQIKNANQVIASSPYLEKKYSEINKFSNSKFISPTLDKSTYNACKFHYEKDVTNIGWTGTHSTKKYIKIIEPYLKKISKVRNIKFIIIGNFDYHINDVNYEIIKWSKETEIFDLLSFDIGVYPLYKDEWSLGKSGLKCLQYMALGIPSVSTNYGNNLNIVTNNNNGYLIENNQWEDTLIKLIDSSKKRTEIAKNALNYISLNNSIEALNKKYRKVLDS